MSFNSIRLTSLIVSSPTSQEACARLSVVASDTMTSLRNDNSAAYLYGVGFLPFLTPLPLGAFSQSRIILRLLANDERILPALALHLSADKNVEDCFHSYENK